MDERERARKASRAIGNALLIAAGVLFALGALAIGIILEDLDENFGVGTFEGPSFVDYLESGLYPSLLLAPGVAILASTGVFLRWLAIQQDAQMEEFDLLLHLIEGVEPEPESEP